MKTANLEPKDRIIVALDVDDPGKAIKLVQNLRDHVGAFKIGLELLTSSLVRFATCGGHELNNFWFDFTKLFELTQGKLMWDGKFDDIPNTVGGATRSLLPLKPKFFTVHATAGSEAMRKVASNSGDAMALAVTVLTSLDFAQLNTMGFVNVHSESGDDFVLRIVRHLAHMAEEAGIRGIVCSPKEVSGLRKILRPETILVTPSVRPDWAAADDQKRVMTPGEAIKAGADYLVIGRPITKPPPGNIDSIKAACLIANEIAQALQEMGR